MAAWESELSFKNSFLALLTGKKTVKLCEGLTLPSSAMAEGYVGLPQRARGGCSDLCCDRVSETSSVQTGGQEVAMHPLHRLTESLTLQSHRLLIRTT